MPLPGSQCSIAKPFCQRVICKRSPPLRGSKKRPPLVCCFGGATREGLHAAAASDCRIFPARKEHAAAYRHATAATDRPPRLVHTSRRTTIIKMGLAATLDAFLATCFTRAVTAAGAAPRLCCRRLGTQLQLLRPMLGFAGGVMTSASFFCSRLH